jgi:small subunit ribosomal protein S2
MANNISTKELLEAGVHFGHLKRKWNPKMLPYIFMEKKGIHIIDLNKTKEALETAAEAMKNIAASGRKILFVATKKQAQEIVQEAAAAINMPFVTERWLGGMFTNFSTIRKSIKKMQSIEKMLNDGTLDSVTKKERLQLTRQKIKMEKVLGGIANITKLPAAVFLVDIMHEDIALQESQKLGMQTFAIVDTNSDPTKVDFPIPGNDDATKSIAVIVNFIAEAIKQGLQERSNRADDVEDIEEQDLDKEKTRETSDEANDRKRRENGGGRQRTGGPGGGPGKGGFANKGPRKF